MKKLRLIAGLVLMLLVSIPLLTSLSSCKKKCKCDIAPTNLSFVEEQADGLVFTFKSSGGADGYVITITNPLTGAKIEDGFTLNSADPKKRKVLKANFPSFFQPATFYQATIHRDCGRVSGCPKEVSEKTPPILIQTQASPNRIGTPVPDGPNIVQIIGTCNQYTFVVDSILYAERYVLFAYDETNQILYSDTSLTPVFPVNYTQIPQTTSNQWTYSAKAIMKDKGGSTNTGRRMSVCCVVIDDNDLGATADLDAIVSSVNNCNEEEEECYINIDNHTVVITTVNGGSPSEGVLSGTINIPYNSNYRYKIAFRKQGATDGWYSFNCTTPTNSSDDSIAFYFKSTTITVGVQYEVIVVPVAPNSECLHCPE